MLRFRIHQLYLPSLGRYLLPLPKLTGAQLALLSSHLEGKGFRVSKGTRPGKRTAMKGTHRIALDGGLGLAASASDMLDALAPAIPALLSSPRSAAGRAGSDSAAAYFSLKRSGNLTELQFFPRMESLRTWECLRRDGLCGLTADEAEVLNQLLGKASSPSSIECFTARPREGSEPLQFGKNVFFKSAVRVSEFLSSLRTIESQGTQSDCFLPRDSVMAVPRVRVETRIDWAELGEWCFMG